MQKIWTGCDGRAFRLNFMGVLARYPRGRRTYILPATLRESLKEYYSRGNTARVPHFSVSSTEVYDHELQRFFMTFLSLWALFHLLVWATALFDRYSNTTPDIIVILYALYYWVCGGLHFIESWLASF